MDTVLDQQRDEARTDRTRGIARQVDGLSQRLGRRRTRCMASREIISIDHDRQRNVEGCRSIDIGRAVIDPLTRASRVDAKRQTLRFGELNLARL